MKNNVYLASKPRYEILDGLRGVAALLVVGYHLFETYFHGGPDQPINHGYLAVDFFFVLSGFVIGYAYDDRWNRMSTWGFIKRRLIRLHPMVIFGSFVGAVLFYFGDCSDFPLIKDTPWQMVILIMLWAFTMIPIPASMDVRGWGETNPLNGPAWSLQWEYLANLLYALIFRRLPKIALVVCVIIFAFMPLILCLDIDVSGFLAARSYASYNRHRRLEPFARPIADWAYPSALSILLRTPALAFRQTYQNKRRILVVFADDCRSVGNALDGHRHRR